MSVLCVLPNKRKIKRGDKVYRIDLAKTFTAKGAFNDDGDKYLTFEEGGEALVKAGSDYWKGKQVYIHLK